MNLPWSAEQVGVAVGLLVLSTLISTGIVAAYLVLIADDHFVAHHAGLRRRIASPILRVLWIITKNLLGVLLVVTGVVLSLPGVPGQGLLTIFVGVLLLDVPGKRSFELRIVRRPKLRKTIDRLRARFDRPPLQLEPEAPGSAREVPIGSARSRAGSPAGADPERSRDCGQDRQ